MPRYLVIALSLCAVVATLAISLIAWSYVQHNRWVPIGERVAIDTWTNRTCHLFSESQICRPFPR